MRFRRRIREDPFGAQSEIAAAILALSLAGLAWWLASKSHHATLIAHGALERDLGYFAYLFMKPFYFLI